MASIAHARQVRAEKGLCNGGALWTDLERARLKALYPVATEAELLRAFPGRTYRALRFEAEKYDLHRPRPEPKYTPDPLCRKLAETRKARNLSQRALAKRIGCDRKVLSTWEAGKRSPVLFLLRAWLDALELDACLEPKGAGIKPLTRDQLMARRAA